MTISTSYLAYTDCFDAMDKALEDGRGIRIPLPDRDAAVFLRMRMHKARSVDRERNAQIYAPGDPKHGSSVYDPLVCRIREDYGQTYLYVEANGAFIKDIEGLSETEEEDIKVLDKRRI